MSIVVFVNPRSRANRRDPGRSARFAALIGTSGRVIAPSNLEVMGAEARALASTPPAVIAIDGGDGTLHKTLSALIAAFGEAPLPPLAILTGGTMNVVASSLGIRSEPLGLLAQVRNDVAIGRPIAVVRRRCLRFGVDHGFVFGNGFMSNFLEEYYAAGSYGASRALLMGGRLFASALVDGPLSAQVFRPFRGRVFVDGQELPWNVYTGVGAATVREVGLGFKLNHRADEDPDRFSVLAIHAAPLSILRDAWAVHRGRGVDDARGHSAVASRLLLEPEAGPFGYTIDGDLYESPGRMEIHLGPQLSFVRPR